MIALILGLLVAMISRILRRVAALEEDLSMVSANGVSIQQYEWALQRLHVDSLRLCERLLSYELCLKVARAASAAHFGQDDGLV